MEDSAKYLIHADIRASGVVERSDVVGAIFGQTEGLLGEQLDLRTLQESSKVGRIDVEIESEAGRSYGTVTIASGLDRAETAVLAAALETIDRVGPCRAEFQVTELEDARAAKRRNVVDRATDLLAEFEESTLSSRELVEEVRRSARVEDVTDYEGLPAGPRVADSDALVVVEGRADVLQLLRYGIKNAIAVEGTDVPDAVADLTHRRTTTTFLDGDRGGDLILKELAQVGSVDYVTFAPAGKSVEDLTREEVLSALRKKAPYDQLSGSGSPRDAFAGEAHALDPSTGADDRGGSPPSTVASRTADAGGAPPADAAGEGSGSSAIERAPTADDGSDGAGTATADGGASAGPSSAASSDDDANDTDPSSTADPSSTTDPSSSVDTVSAEAASTAGADAGSGAGSDHDDTADEPTGSSSPETLAGHVEAIAGTDQVRLLDGDFDVLAEAPAAEAFDAIADTEPAPATVILDGELSQRILDVAAQRGVGQIVATATGEFVKQPADVRVRTASDV